MRQTGVTTLLTDDAERMIGRMVSEQLNTFLESRRIREEDTECVTETFDTTQPVDSLTGTPPLKSRMRERKGVREEEDSRNEKESITTEYGVETGGRKSGVIAESTALEMKENHVSEECEKRNERKGSGNCTGLSIFMCGSTILTVVILIYMMLKKRKR